MDREIAGRVATWLELAVAPDWCKERATVRLHSVGGREDGCYALSMDGRWLCASNGKLTAFKGREAAVQFLKSVRVEQFEEGETPERPLCCNGDHFGLRLDATGHLTACRALDGEPRFND